MVERTLMFEEIDDTGFQCIAGGIGGVIVPETVSIVECCQDPDNLNIIYMRVSISGVFAYTPDVTVSWEGGSVNVSPYFISKYAGYGQESFPINTNCGSVSVLLAYNVAAVIPNFATIPEVQIAVKVIGDTSLLGVSNIVRDSGVFISTNPTATATLVKGLIPKPYKLYFDPTTSQLKVMYSGLGSTACLCAINCVNPETDDFTLTVCNDELQEVTVNANSIVGDPTNINIVFSDALGNQTVISNQAMVNVKPAAPSVIQYTDPTFINVNPYFISVNGTPIDSTKVKVQVLKYENNPDNVTVWKDWTSKPWKSLYDRNTRRGRKYGYAVRFQGEFGDISNLSDWAVIEVS
jgi:hypothetical protein